MVSRLDLNAKTTLPSLERAPGKSDNWVEKAGGLPPYMDRIARHLHSEKGMEIGHAIASAVNTCKRWCAGTGDVKADTQAKACKAVAQWEKKKASTRSKKKLNASLPTGKASDEDMIELMLSEGFKLNPPQSDYHPDEVELRLSFLRESR